MMGNKTLLRRKWLRVIINNDFLENGGGGGGGGGGGWGGRGGCYDLAFLPSIICLGRLRIACRYIFDF